MSQDTIFIIGVLILFFALTVIPQFIQRRRHQQEISSILPGAWVVTAGGVVGQVTAIDARFTRLRINEKGEMVFATQAIRSRISVPQDLFSPAQEVDEGEFDQGGTE